MKLQKLIFTLLFITTLVNANPNNQVVSIGKKHVINSKVLGQNREIYIKLPEYYHDSNQFYPVIFHLDGLSLFKFLSVHTDMTSKSLAMPDSIVVGIKQKNRHKELKMPGSIDLLKFISDELIPYVESNYRASNHRTIAGHSLGGTFVLTSLLKAPELFDSYIAVSPVLGVKNTPSLEDFKLFFQKNKTLHKQVYLSKGNEKEDYFNAVKQLAEMLTSLENHNIHSYFNNFEGQSHETVMVPAMYDAFNFLFEGWIIPDLHALGLGAFDSPEELADIGGIKAIYKYYQNFSKTKGYPIDLPPIIYSRLGFIFVNHDLDEDLMRLIKNNGKGNAYVNYYLGQNLIHKGKLDLAIEFYKLDSEKNSNSGISWNSLAQSYQKNKQFNKAKKAFEKAVKIAKINQNPNYTKYKENLKKLELL